MYIYLILSLLCNRNVQRKLVLQPTVHVSQHRNVHHGPGLLQELVLLDLESAVSIFSKKYVPNSDLQPNVVTLDISIYEFCYFR